MTHRLIFTLRKHDEDLNTTLIFVRFRSRFITIQRRPQSQASLFSAVSSAFVIDVQSKLEPDSSERSEAYLRAILLSLNRSIVPDRRPFGSSSVEWSPSRDYYNLEPPVRKPCDVTVGRIRRNAGQGVAEPVPPKRRGIERRGDRRRKFDGPEKWPFRLFTESIPVILQIALLPLTCGLSRYMWSVNISVARVVISFPALGILFYVGIVAAGISSYECPFQTPASAALRYLSDSGTTRRLLASLSPPKESEGSHVHYRSQSPPETCTMGRAHLAMIRRCAYPFET